MAVREHDRCRKIDCQALCDMIRPGNRIFISSGSATPLKAMAMIAEAKHGNLFDLEIIQLAIPDAGGIITDDHSHKFRWKTFNVGEAIAQGIHKGRVDFIPSNLAEIPYLFYSDSLDIDVAIIQTSYPDSRGFLNLGIASDVADLVIKNVPLAIAEMNPHVPITHGDTSVHLSQFGACVESDIPLIEKEAAPYDDIADRIGWHVANIIEDASTVALHFGSIYNAIADHLRAKKNLRICSHTVSDWIIDLVESGAMAQDRGLDHQGIIMASYCLGSSKLYDYVSHNPFFNLVPLLRASYQASLPKIQRLVSVVDALRVDITGNAVEVPPEDCFLPGFEGKLVLSTASTMSRQGKSIVTVRSVGEDGGSNIVIAHKGHRHVRSLLGTTRYVVTEYGTANVAGKSVRERTLAIIDIAHPAHREALIEEAKKEGYIYGDQIYVTQYAANYPFSLETIKTFGGNLEVKFRPIKPSDEDMMRRLFYGASDESKFMRYFTAIRVMPHKKMQPYVNVDYDTTLSLVGTIQYRGRERIIAEARYVAMEDGWTCEMAFVVDDEYSGKGIAKFLLEYLIGIARERGIKRLLACVMPQNLRMARVFKSARITPSVREDDDQVEYLFDLAVAE